VPTITLKKTFQQTCTANSKKRAEEHHRSLNREIIATLKTAADAPRGFDAADLEASVRHARALFRRPVTEREINAWKRAERM
jgi:Arc-like DNA binding dprotein